MLPGTSFDAASGAAVDDMVPTPPLSDAIEAKILGDDCKVDVMGNAFEFYGTSSYNGDACVARELADTFSLTHGGKSTVPLRYATIDEVRVALEAELFEAVAVSMTEEVAWDDGADVTFLSVAGDTPSGCDGANLTIDVSSAAQANDGNGG